MQLEWVAWPSLRTGKEAASSAAPSTRCPSLTCVQASDFCLLAMALVTLFTFNYQSSLLHPPPLITRLTCLSLWVVPLITGASQALVPLQGAGFGSWSLLTAF